MAGDAGHAAFCGAGHGNPVRVADVTCGVCRVTLLGVSAGDEASEAVLAPFAEGQALTAEVHALAGGWLGMLLAEMVRGSDWEAESMRWRPS